MKRTTLYVYAALSLLLLGLTYCTQNKTNSLPKGTERTPMVFTATGLNPTATTTVASHSPVDSSWQDISSVAVMVDGTVKEYAVTPLADNTSAKLTASEPHYWTEYGETRITAWWPYIPGQTGLPDVVVRADQSAQADFKGCDLITSDMSVAYGSSTLRFTHRMALVHICLTECPDWLTSVRLTNLSTADSNPAEIVPYAEGDSIYSAFVAPQQVTQGTAFVTCTFAIGRTFVYRMPANVQWMAGGEYTYTVSLAAAEDPGYIEIIDEDGRLIYDVYNEKGLRNIAKRVNSGKTDINIILTDDIILTEEWTPIIRYNGIFDGNNHTISGLKTDGNYGGLCCIIDSNGRIKDLTLQEVQVTGSEYVGGVVGINYGAVSGCTVSGSVSTTGDSAGGITGENRGTLTACCSTVSVTAGRYAGGITGYNYYPMTACYHAGGSVSGHYAGGVAGKNYGTLTACYWSGSIGKGIGDGVTDGVMRVTNGNWKDAVNTMNNALNGTVWQYELIGALPTLTSKP